MFQLARGLLVLFAASLWIESANAAPSSLTDALTSVFSRASGGVAVLVTDLESGKTVFEKSASSPLKPASVLKVITAATVLETLGPEHRFRTQLFLDRESKGVVRNLWVKGAGDPSFTMESMWMLARRVKLMGIERIETLWFDDTAFVGSNGPQGQRAYETGSSALSFNFNSIGVEVCPSSAGRPAVVAVDPWEVGATVHGQIRTIASGSGEFSVESKGSGGKIEQVSFSVGGTIGANRECETIYRSVADPARYFGVTFRELLELLGVQVGEGPKQGATPGGASLLYSARSKPLRQIVEDLNHYSNNFIGEQLLFALGYADGSVFDRARGIARMSDYVERLGFDRDDFKIMDGSGLSHANRVTARMIMTVLKRMYSNAELGPEFVESLSVSGRNGTLKKRRFGNGDILVRGKTGTLDGVSSLAGYLQSRRGRKFAFVIIQNGPASKDGAIGLENRLVSTIFESAA